MKKLFEILIPARYRTAKVTIGVKHHRAWDEYVRKYSDGLTINPTSKGQWVYKNNLLEEHVIPVRIFCSEKDMKKIVQFTLSHYRQIAVMYYELSNNCHIVYAKGK